MGRVELDSLRHGLVEGLAGIDGPVPFGGHDLAQEMLQRRLVPVEQGPVEITRVPVDQYRAEIEQDRVERDGPGACVGRRYFLDFFHASNSARTASLGG